MSLVSVSNIFPLQKISYIPTTCVEYVRDWCKRVCVESIDQQKHFISTVSRGLQIFTIFTFLKVGLLVRAIRGKQLLITLNDICLLFYRLCWCRCRVWWQFNGGFDSARLNVGLDDLRDLFQHKWFYDSSSQWAQTHVALSVEKWNPSFTPHIGSHTLQAHKTF